MNNNVTYSGFFSAKVHALQLWVLLVLGFTCLTFFESHAQENRIPPARIILKDTIDVGDSSRNGLINKIIQPIRFRENQIHRERERMVQLIRRLADQGEMSIDTLTVNAIVNDLIQLTQTLAATQDTTVRLQDEIDQAILDLDTKAPKQLVDSIQIQLGNVLQGLLDDSKAENTAARKELLAKLTALRQIQFSCGMEGLPTYNAILGDTLSVDYQKCLNAQTRIFGWHLPSMNDRIQNYNLNYLTDLILYGFELGVDGRENNTKTLLGLLQGDLMKNIQPFGKAVSLSVYSNSSTVTGAFLNQNASQNQFITRIKELIASYNLKGINIYFDQLQAKDSRNFSRFISLLKSELAAVDKNLILTLSIPPIANTRDLARASSYDFASLNSLVDFYLVQTHKLNITATRIPFSLSPLYPDQANSRGSIEGTFAFYSNGKVPAGKLVMTVSYQGISWPMPDFVPGSRGNDFGSLTDYKSIQESIVSTIGKPDGAVMGYDPEQASAYLNYGNMGSLRQVWFDDSKSLADKYTWALDNAIGGVAIWGLGYDEGYTELWDVLGATLIRVDSVVVNTELLEAEKVPQKLSLLEYLWTYKQDIQWAGLNDIYIGDPNKKPEPDYCYFEVYPDRDSIQRLAKANQVLDFWQNRNEFVRYDTTEYYSINSYQDCVCMVGRWDRYAEINGIASIILFGLLFIGILIILFGIRKYGDEWSMRSLFTAISIGIGLLALIALFFYLFFNTQIGFIGAGSNEVTIWVLILIFAFGISAGLIINRLRMAKKFAYRDLP
ncbi:MAG TPA: glycoside hydrolase family 18 protein [Algoriphagus sp.]|nr:glycoside hydrolase family 18 protein [Algoriphagus sp.]